jgi:signal peptidase I
MNDENKTTPNGSPPPLPIDPIRPPAAPPTASPAEPASSVVTPGVPPRETVSSQDLADMLTIPMQETDQAEDALDPGTLQKVGSGFMAVLAGLFSWIIFPLAVVLILHYFVFQAYHVLGTSMNPTLQQTDYLIISKVGYTEAMLGRIFQKNALYLPKRGQIIVFHYPKDPSEIFVKRVVGLPGDHLVIKNGVVTLYTKAAPQGYNPDAGYEPAGTTTLIDTDETVQASNVFVMGDNRTPGGSYDSREWGELPSSYIIGNAVLRLLPLDAIKIL